MEYYSEMPKEEELNTSVDVLKLKIGTVRKSRNYALLLSGCLTLCSMLSISDAINDASTWRIAEINLLSLSATASWIYVIDKQQELTALNKQQKKLVLIKEKNDLIK